MLTCKDVTRLISQGQDRKLSRWERIGLRLHLWMCDSCKLFEKQMEQMRHAIRHGWSRGDLPVDRPLSDESRERIRQALREHSNDGNI